MAKRTQDRIQQNEPATPSRGPLIVLTAGSIAVAALVGWALTRTVEPAVPEASTVATTPAPSALPPSGTGFEPSTAAPSAATPPPVQTPEGAVPRVNAEQLKQMVDTNAITLLDVRDSVSYNNGHIPGAIHIPFARVEAEASRLPKGKPIVAYCTWPNEESSAGAALILQRQGFNNVSALLGGLEAWRGQGYEVRSGLAP